MILRSLLICTIFLFSFLTAQNSRVSGKIAGQVIDKESRQPVTGANVYIEGNTFGSSTDEDGYFYILNIPAGNYTLVVSFIGYTSYKVENIKVVPDFTFRQIIELSPQIMEGEVVVVTAEKPMIQKEVTSTVKEVSALEIRHSPTSSFTQILAQQVGAVQTGRGRRSGGIHIRGGRNNEIGYYVDGVNSNDPFSGFAGVSIDNNSIEQLNIISGGFNAEYGESMSGVVQIVTKAGNLDDYSLELETTSDALFGASRYDWGYNKYFASLSGPVPALQSLRGSFYSTLGILEQGDRNPSIINQNFNDRQRINGSLKINLEPVPGVFRLQLNARINRQEQHRYSHSRSANPAWLKQGLKQKTGDDTYSFTFTHTLSSNTWYDVTLVSFNNYNRYSAQNGKSFDEWRSVLGTRIYSRTSDWMLTAINNGWYDPKTDTFSGMSEEEAFYYYYQNIANNGDGFVSNDNGEWLWESLEQKQKAYNDRYYDTGYWAIENDELIYQAFSLSGYSSYLADSDNPAYEKYKYKGDMHQAFGIDEFADFRFDFTPWWHSHSNSYFQGEAVLSSQLDKNNFMKLGGWMRNYNLKYKDIQFLNSNPYYDNYNVNPIEAAFFVQDKFQHEDLVINAGARFDYWNPDSKNLTDIGDLNSELEKTNPKWKISPRVGISFAASSEMNVYAYYGKFFQRVDLSDLYQNRESDVTNGLPLIGNPDLPAQETTAYEVGFQQQLKSDVSLKLNAFYKDAQNLLSTDKVNSYLDGAPVDYTQFFVRDFSKIKGFEVELKKRVGPGLAGTLTYSFLDAKGTGSSSTDFYYDYLGSNTELPRKEYPLDFDITHDIKTNINYYIPSGQGIDFFGTRPFSDVNVNIFANWNSGAAYTPENNNGQEERGSGRLPSYFNLDMRIDKYVFLGSSNIELNFFVDIRNLFDIRNIEEVYNMTGQPDDDGRQPVYDQENLGIYQFYDIYGYQNPQDMYNADVASWKRKVKIPSHYSNPRIIRTGIKIKF